VTDKLPIILKYFYYNYDTSAITSNGATKIYVAVNRKQKIPLSLTVE